MLQQRVGKRQVRPNLTRTDFGYTERTRTKPAKKPKREEEDENGEGRPRAGDARNLTVDFTKLDMGTLKKYKKFYRLKTRQNATKSELAQAVARHFAAQVSHRRRTSARLAFLTGEPRVCDRRWTKRTPSRSSCGPVDRARCSTTAATT